MAGPDEQQGLESTEDDLPEGGQGQGPDDQRGDEGQDPEKRRLSAEAKKWRLRARELEATNKDLTDREKSELQRLTERLEIAEKRAEAEAAKNLRFEIAAEHGIASGDAMQFLHGDTREELTKNAKAFVERFGPSGNGQQRADFSSGVRRPVQRPKTMNDIIRQAAGR
jgi:hypothetical protein